MAIDHQVGADSGAAGHGALSVGQLAASARVRADTVRYYERAGLLPAPDRTDGDHRRYGPADVDRLLFIRGAKRLGLRLAEIRELVTIRDTGTCPCGPAEAVLREHVREIDREIDRLTALRAELTGMVAGLSGRGAGSSVGADCLEPAPGTWCAPDCRVPAPAETAKGGDRNVLVLR